MVKKINEWCVLTSFLKYPHFNSNLDFKFLCENGAKIDIDHWICEYIETYYLPVELVITRRAIDDEMIYE